jgi:hypothetical protein
LTRNPDSNHSRVNYPLPDTPKSPPVSRPQPTQPRVFPSPPKVPLPALESVAPVPPVSQPEPFSPPVNLPLRNTVTRPAPPTALPDVRSPPQSAEGGSPSPMGKTEVSTPPKPPAVSAPITPESKPEAAPKPLPQEQTSSPRSGPDVPVTGAIPRLDFIGSWGTDNKECRVGQGGPLSISANRAEAFGGKCEFTATTQETVNHWRVRADCSRNGERWKANIKLTLNGNRLTWSSERGTISYVRCSR